MKNKRGLSDVVTTVVIIALALVAITVVWVVVQNLISSNTDSINLQRDCLDINLDFQLVSNTSSNYTISVKRTFGSVAIGGIRIIVYNSSDSEEEKHESNLVIGQMTSKTINIINATEYTVIPYFKSNGKDLDCSNIVRKKI